MTDEVCLFAKGRFGIFSHKIIERSVGGHHWSANSGSLHSSIAILDYCDVCRHPFLTFDLVFLLLSVS